MAELAAQEGIDLDGVEIIHPPSSADFDLLIESYLKARGRKAPLPEKARTLFESDYTLYATMMMFEGKVAGMVSGACHETASTMRPALQLLKAAAGYRWVSSVFFMLLPDRVYIYGDCALITAPTAEQLGELATTSASPARAFGISPRVALLSYATGDSNTGEMVQKVREATRLARLKDPATPYEGPIQFDAAVNEEVAAAKITEPAALRVAGKANVCVFPDLNAGNTAYKAVQRATGCTVIGPVVQGLSKPVNDLSRGSSVQDIVMTAVITAIQAQQRDGAP